MQDTIYNVNFPYLGFHFQVNPIAFYIGNFPIHWYGLIIASGFLIAYLYTISRTKYFRINAGHFTDAVLAGALAGIVGARLYYIIFFPGKDYLENPLSILYIWDGGIAIYGGLIGGLLAGIISAKKNNMNLWATLDLTSLGFLIGQFIGRWGNFVNQEAFGVETNLPWCMLSEKTDGVPVHPCFLYESIWCAVGFIILHIISLHSRVNSGKIFSLYLIWYGSGRFFIESLRTDSLLIPQTSLRISQVVAIITIILGLIFLLLRRFSESSHGAQQKFLRN